MRIQEAKFIGEALKALEVDVCINLGAGNIVAQRSRKPWIDQQIFEPLARRGAKVIHTDSKMFPGITRIIDLSIAKSIEQISTFTGRKCILLCNVLEHVPKDHHGSMLTTISKSMNKGDSLIISVPFDYPYHADPIDNLYRPSSKELELLLDLEWKASNEIEAGSFASDLAQMSMPKAFRKLIKPIWPFQRIRKFRENISRLRFLNRSYKVSIVIGVKK